jgi:putative Mg2+ transporter-C (MgtC) family protein
MQAFIDYMHEINIVTVIVRIVIATIMGGFIGIERFKQGRAAGMRTHILVALGSALASMIGLFLSQELHMANDPTRIAAQVVSGIGFLGMGTILVKGRFQITGLTTAAGLWATAAIGLALGMGFYTGSIAAFVCAVLTITLMSKLEYILTKKYNRFGIYVEIKSDEYVRTAIDMLKEKYKTSAIQVTVPRSGKSGNVGIEANVHILQKKHRISPDAVAREIETNDYVIFAIESI